MAWPLSAHFFGYQNQFSETTSSLIARKSHSTLCMSSKKWLGLVLNLAVAGLVTIVVGVAVALRNTISVGFTGVSLTQIVSFTSYLKMMILFWARLQTAMAAVERIRNFSNDTEKEDSSAGALEPPEDLPAKGKVEIQRFSAKYM